MNAFDDDPIRKAMFEELRQKAERALDTRRLAADAPEMAEAQKLFQELQVHQLELEMQNEDLSLIAAELEMQRAKFSSLFELAPVGYCVLNIRGFINNINQTACKLLAGRRDFLLQRLLQNFIYADDADIFLTFLRKVQSEPAEQNCQLRMLRAEQPWFYAQLSGLCSGKVSGGNCYITITDITEKKTAELELKQAKQRLEIALSASATGIWEIDITSGKISFDGFATAMLGLRDEFDGKYVSFLSMIDDSDRESFDSAFRTAMVRKKDFNVEFALHPPGATRKYISVRGQLVYNEDANGRFAGTVTDITAKKLLELETQQLKEVQQQEIRVASLRAEENARRMLSEVLHGNVGQMLYALRMDLDQLKGDKPGPYYKHASDLLSQAIYEVRNISFELAPAILRDFGVVAALKEMGRRLSTGGLSIEVTNSSLGQLEMDFMINIYRIVQELVNNGIKHGKASHIAIGLARKKSDIYISVTDNGSGFDVKQRLKTGDGTGLSSIRNRIDLYKGAIDITSAINKGTTVAVRLKQY